MLTKNTGPAAIQQSIKELNEHADRAMNEFIERVKERTPVDTGALQEGWSVSGSLQTGFEVNNPVEYAAYVEYGTDKSPPHAMLRTTINEIQQIIDSTR